MRILSLYKVNLPIAVPVFQLLFAFDRIRHILKHFVPNESISLVERAKAFDRFCAMLKYPPFNVRCHPDVERAARLAGKDIDARLLGHDVCISGVHGKAELVSGCGQARCPTRPTNAILYPLIDFVT